MEVSREIKKFTDIADSWWDETGPFRSLHAMNHTRLKYILDHLPFHSDINQSTSTKLNGRNILDIGCGGGLLTSPLSRLGANVMGLDLGEENIAVAKEYASKHSLNIDYKNIPIDQLESKYEESFDVITIMEVVEHVDDLQAFLTSSSRYLKRGGMMFISTINKKLKSFIYGIVVAEYLMRIVPKGTHNWNKFISPEKLSGILTKLDIVIDNVSGVGYSPFTGRCKLINSCDVNYILSASKC